MIIVLLIAHGLLAVALIGAVTHQVLASGRATLRPEGSFVARLANVRAESYSDAVVVIYALDFILGAIIYPTYRVEVRPHLEDIGMFMAAGAFETKEHIAVLGLGLLPAYWLFWKTSHFAAHVVERRNITRLLAFFVWWNFLVGHVLNNFRGLSQ